MRKLALYFALLGTLVSAHADISFIYLGHWESHKDVPGGTFFVDGQVSIQGPSLLTSDNYSNHYGSGTAFFGSGAVLSIFTGSSDTGWPLDHNKDAWTDVQIGGGPDIQLWSGDTNAQTAVHSYALTGTSVHVGLQQIIQGSVYTRGDYTLTRDDTPPSIVLSTQQATAPQWISTSTPVQVRIVSSDSLSGLSTLRYRFDDTGSWISIPPVNGAIDANITFPAADGTHFISVVAVDKIGNTTDTKTVSFNFDGSPPSPTTLSAALSGSNDADGNPHVSAVELSWTAFTDAYSGLDSWKLQLDPGAGSYTSSLVTTDFGIQHQTWTLATRDLAFPHRAALSASDKVGNASSVSSVSIFIPEVLRIAATPVATIESSTEDLVVTVLLSSTPKNLLNYDSIQLFRLDGDAGQPLPQALTAAPLVFSPADIVTADGTLKDPSRWSVDPTSHGVVYIDRIPASTGAGHKKVRYKVLTSIHGVLDYGNTTTPIALPNHKGTVAFQVVDLNGNPTDSPDFRLSSDGHALLALQGSDVDRDSWELEADRVVKRGAPGAELTSYQALNGSSSLIYEPVAGTYPPLVVPITLLNGINNLQLFWKENADDTAAYASEILGVTTVYNAATGLYSVTVTQGYASTGGATEVITRPGEVLKFSIDAPDLDPSLVSWDFGDGESTQGTKSADHAYAQVAGQSSGTVTHDLIVHLGSTDVNLTVTVQDTQEGELLVDEKWTGAHKIIGIVVVPIGLTLSISSGTPVSMEGSLGSGYGQGIDVKGSLLLGDGAVLRRKAGQSQKWGTVLVRGSASLGAAEIQDADRGVSVADGGSAQLLGTKLHENNIGLHVVGSAQVEVNGAWIHNNAVYGVKEDAGGRPWMRNTTIGVTDSALLGRGRVRNYYSFHGSLLDMNAVNHLTATNNGTAVQNSGNLGE